MTRERRNLRALTRAQFASEMQALGYAVPTVQDPQALLFGAVLAVAAELVEANATLTAQVAALKARVDEADGRITSSFTPT